MKYKYLNKYGFKIKKVEEISKIVGKFNSRKKKISMCHGVFDIVHPGHVRHLFYAKSKADILVVSITADQHISKGHHRPHVPEKLRALNLAAFEMVDYVIIDKNKTPLTNIKKIKPNYFAKGFEYGKNNMPKETISEINEIKKFGGSMIFTPGDLVLSSTKILETSLPNLHLEKLLVTMDNNSITFEDLKNTLKHLNKFKVHVVGDTIIDTYTNTSLIGGQVKTPTFSVLYHNDKKYLGGAGIVSKHLKSAGADVTFTTILGKDELNKFVVEDCKKNKIKINFISEKNRPTTNKNVFIAGGYRLLKVDTLDNKPIEDLTINKISKLIAKIKCDAIIFSDFRHGIFNEKTIKLFSSKIKKNVFKVADSQVATRWGNISEFTNFDLITPNEREARFCLADQDSSIGVLSAKLRDTTKFKNLILKLGSKGVLCVGKKNSDQYFNFDSFAENVLDPVGAGDALLSYATLVYLKTKSLAKAGLIGSIAAACECEKDGNIPIKVNDIVEKIEKIEKITN